MNKKIILFEGYDGSGKTTLIENFEKFLIEKGKTCLLVSRDFNKPINSITEIIKDKESDISPTTEILLRYAREIERVKVIKQNISKYDYILLDRSVISATSWVGFHNKNLEDFKSIISDIVGSIGECYLVYCYLSFEETWSRVNSRPDKPLSKKEEQGKDINEKLYNSLRQTYLDFDYITISKIEIQTNQSREKCIEELIKKLG